MARQRSSRRSAQWWHWPGNSRLPARWRAATSRVRMRPAAGGGRATAANLRERRPQTHPRLPAASSVSAHRAVDLSTLGRLVALCHRERAGAHGPPAGAAATRRRVSPRAYLLTPLLLQPPGTRSLDPHVLAEPRRGLHVAGRAGAWLSRSARLIRQGWGACPGPDD